MVNYRQDGNALRGLFYGILLSIPLWILIAVAIWFFCLR
jgi:hypothetical protein